MTDVDRLSGKQGYKVLSGYWKINKTGEQKYSDNIGFKNTENCAEYLGVLNELKKNDVTVDLPMALLLLQKHGTVTICHSRTQNLAEICRTADILVAAVGKVNVVTADMVKPGAVVIDVAMNRNQAGKLCGDVDYPAVKEIVSAITPVPGGVGPMTRAMLMKNTLLAAQKHQA